MTNTSSLKPGFFVVRHPGWTVTAVILVWVSWGALMCSLATKPEREPNSLIQTMGQMGDSFAIINGFFSAIGLLVVIATLQLQRRATLEQSKGMERVEQLQQQSAAALLKQAEILRVTGEINGIVAQISECNSEIEWQGNLLKKGWISHPVDANPQSLINDLMNRRNVLREKLNQAMQHLST